MRKQLIFNHKKSEDGFTLMEMLIVVTIIGILAAIILPRFVTSSAAAKSSAYVAEKQTINSQLELFYFTVGAYPSAMTNTAWTDAESGVNYTDYWPNGVPTSDVYGDPWDYDANLGRISED